MINYHILSLNFTMGSETSTIHPVLIRTPKDLILCDAGYPGQADLLERELNKLGFALTEVTKIFISHHDHDHMGSLAELKRLTCSPFSVPVVEGKPHAVLTINS